MATWWLYRGYIGFYRDDGKENGNCYNIYGLGFRALGFRIQGLGL